MFSRAYHESKLAHAMAVFEMHARGPLFEEFSEKLQAECDKHWRAGRQMCEVLSLTGHPCTNPIHRGGSEGAGGGEQAEPREDDRHVLLYIIDYYVFLYIKYIYNINCLYSYPQRTTCQRALQRRQICMRLQLWSSPRFERRSLQP